VVGGSPHMIDSPSARGCHSPPLKISKSP
jgi:hypothetical protein